LLADAIVIVVSPQEELSEQGIIFADGPTHNATVGRLTHAGQSGKTVRNAGQCVIAE
jgi:co-chaperonin GroES (HSP10)